MDHFDRLVCLRGDRRVVAEALCYIHLFIWGVWQTILLDYVELVPTKNQVMFCMLVTHETYKVRRVIGDELSKSLLHLW